MESLLAIIAFFTLLASLPGTLIALITLKAYRKKKEKLSLPSSAAKNPKIRSKKDKVNKTEERVHEIAPTIDDQVKALDLIEKAEGFRDAARIKLNQSIRYHKLKQGLDADDCFDKAFEYFQKAVDSIIHNFDGTTLEPLKKAELILKEASRASTRLKKITNDRENHESIAWKYSVIAEKLMDYGTRKDALQCYLNAYNLALNKLGAKHDTTERCRKGIERAYQAKLRHLPFDKWLKKQMEINNRVKTTICYVLVGVLSLMYLYWLGLIAFSPTYEPWTTYESSTFSFMIELGLPAFMYFTLSSLCFLFLMQRPYRRGTFRFGLWTSVLTALLLTIVYVIEGIMIEGFFHFIAMNVYVYVFLMPGLFIFWIVDKGLKKILSAFQI